MASFYSILSVSIRQEIQEKISIGMLMFNENEVYFSYSPNKLKISKDLLSGASFRMLQNAIHGIELQIDEDKASLSNKKDFNLFKNKIFNNTFSSNYIDYLSRYANNLLTYSAPKEIYLELNGDNFKSLFNQYIDIFRELKTDGVKQKPFDAIREKYGQEINAHYNIRLELTHETVKNLIVPVRIDFSGRNEIDVFAQTVDMEANPATVMQHINAFVQLKAVYKTNNEPMKDFLIANEPSKQSFPKQHDIWEQLRTSPLLNYLDLSESGKLLEYAKQHAVIPLSTEA